MESIKESIVDIYINLLLTAISRRHDFAKLVKETDKDAKKYIKENKDGFIPEGYIGLFYVEQLARKMGSSLGEVYNLSKERKEEVVRHLIEWFDPINLAYGDYFDDETEEIIEFQGSASILDLTNEKDYVTYFHSLLQFNA